MYGEVVGEADLRKKSKVARCRGVMLLQSIILLV